MNETLLNKARLNVVSLNKALINGAVERHGSSAGGGGAPSKYIRFADPAVEAVLMANGVSSDGVGITKEDAAAVKSIGTWFKGNTDITSFDEFEYFTGVTFLGTHQTSAGYGAFDGCTNLEYLTLPPSCVDLRVQALANCTSLKRVNGFEHVKTIRDRMATNALLSQDLNLASVEGEIGYAAFAYTGITSISSLGKCTSLANSNSSGSGVFDKCKSLKSVVIPESLTSIGGCAFMDDDALTSVIGLENVSVIKNRAFSGCTSLAYDVLNFRNLSVLEQDALYGIKIKKLNLSTLPSLPYAASARSTYGDRNVLEEVILSDAVSVITAHSFKQNTHLTTITMNRDRITSIEAAAFWDVPLSGDMSFASLTNLGENAFRNTDIESFTAPNVSEIKYDTFRDCSSLKKVDVGDITAIGATAFYNCTAMEGIIIRAITPPNLAQANAFNDTNNCPIYVPDAALEVYKTATNWSAYADRIHPLSELEGSPYITFADAEVERVLMENNVSSDGVGITMADAQAVTTIATWFRNNTTIVTFDECQYFTGITLLNSYSFQGCTSLKSIIIPSSVTQINTESFYNCTSLTNCVIPMSVVSLQNNVFRNCPMTNDINLPNLTSFGTRVFQNTAIRRVVSLGKIPSIPDGDNSSGTFYGCKSLSDVNLHEGLTYIGRSAFAQCTSLALIDIPSSVTVIGWNSFMGSAISSVNAPGATEIRQGAFTYCANLRTISAPIVTTIGQNAFMGCSSLEQLLLPLCETIGDVTFRNCTSLTLLEIGANIKSIGTYQFGDYTAVMPPNLWAIVVRATTPPTLGSNGWYGTTCPIYVPDASVDAYKAATNWSAYASRIRPLSEYVES